MGVESRGWDDYQVLVSPLLLLMLDVAFDENGKIVTRILSNLPVLQGKLIVL